VKRGEGDRGGQMQKKADTKSRWGGGYRDTHRERLGDKKRRAGGGPDVFNLWERGGPPNLYYEPDQL